MSLFCDIIVVVSRFNMGGPLFIISKSKGTTEPLEY